METDTDWRGDSGRIRERENRGVIRYDALVRVAMSTDLSFYEYTIYYSASCV